MAFQLPDIPYGWSIPLLFITVTLIYPFLLLLVRQHRSPLRLLPGPPCPSFFMGNLVEMHDMENTGLVESWEQEHGRSWAYRGFVGGYRLITTDLHAISYILAHAYDYPKPDFVRDSLATMAVGHEGLLTVEGEVHKRQRRILTPAFTASHIRSLAPIFFNKAEQLRDIWLELAGTRSSSPAVPASPRHLQRGTVDDTSDENNDNDEIEEGKRKEFAPDTEFGPRVDVLAWLCRATLDVIGLAGFGYSFNALAATSEPNELAQAFSVIFTTARKFRVITVLRVWFPLLRRFHQNNAVMNQARATMRRIGLELIEERRSEVIAEMQTAGGKNGIDGDQTVLGRDLLSVLIRSSLTTSPSQQMSIPEIICQISTFLAAGNDTTASALCWALYALSVSPLCQSRLRTDLHTICPTSAADELFADIQSLPYLDWVVRESLRLHSPATSTMRMCTKDGDIIPTAETWIGRDGVERSGIEVKKGDIITVPIQAVNKSKRIWGEDAGVFRPERWEHPPQESKCIPGLYSNILTFLNGNPLNGNRACIGYKFALAEIKIFLYVLLRDIEFSIDPSLVVEKQVNVVTRPFIKSEPHNGNQMPLNIRPFNQT